MTDVQRWRATLAEHRTAWIIASLSILLVSLAVLQPGVFDRLSIGNHSDSTTAEKKAAEPTPALDNPHKYSARKPAQKTAAMPPKNQSAEAVTQPNQNHALPGTSAKPLSSRPVAQETKKPAVQPAKRMAKTSSPTTSKPTAKTLDSALAHGHYYVQTGAFSSRENAEKLAAQINRNSWSAKVVKKPGNLFAVWVGPRESRSLADALQASLQQRMNMKGFIIKQP